MNRLITWTKPKIPPRGVSERDWSEVPDTLTVRHVQSGIDTPGFRSRELNVVTTLLDPEAFTRQSLTQLYRDRWLVELNLRSLKSTLEMGKLGTVTYFSSLSAAIACLPSSSASSADQPAVREGGGRVSAPAC